MSDAFIVDAVRIPRALAPKNPVYGELKPVDLLKPLFQALQNRNSLDTEHVQDVILGCSTQVGDQGANLAKIAALYAGWSEAVSGVTINRFCCSGLDAINLAAAKIKSGMENVVAAGGVEQLSKVPMFADKGAWFSDPKVMKKTRFMHMGLAADLIATQNGYSREQLDELALQSHERAGSATRNGYFKNSLIPVPDNDGNPILEFDNAIREIMKPEKLAALPASFTDYIAMGNKVAQRVYPNTTIEARHTAAASPALVDGASLLLIANSDYCEQHNLTPKARIIDACNASDEPVKMLTGHIKATRQILKRNNLKSEDIDLWEVNESFASSVLHYRDSLGIDNNKLNVNGSAIAMGHPLGATGGNLTSILIDELERRDVKRGIISICAGAGIGNATLIERLHF